jgi:hypothetical protein
LEVDVPDAASSRSHGHVPTYAPDLPRGVLADDAPEARAWSEALAIFREASASEREVPGLALDLADAAIDLALAVLARGGIAIATRLLTDAIDLVAAAGTTDAPFETAEAIESVAEELLALHAMLGDREGALATLERCRLVLLALGTDA